MEKKKVLILITKSNWGGAQKYVFDLATNIPKDAYEVTVMAGSEGIMIEKLKESGVKSFGNLAIGRDISIWKDFRAFFELISILRKQRPDVLHLNSSKIGGLGALAGRLTGIKRIIFTSHGWAFNENRTLLSKIIIKSIHWITVVLAHQTISVSDKLKKQMVNWPFINDKIYTIHNAIKPEAIFSKANAELELIKINPSLKQKFDVFNSKKTIIIGSVGELHHIKGYEYALKGISDLIISQKQTNPSINILYLIIGTGEEKVKIESTIKKLGMEENVILLGHVKDAYHYLKMFDIFLLSSLSESFGYVLLEAGLASVPVIATAVGGIPEIIDDMKSGILIQSKKSTEIKNAIEFYLTHKKTRREHGVALHDKVLKEFSIEKMISETLKTYSTSAPQIHS